MKKLISVLVIAAMLLASAMMVTPAFANDDIILNEKNEATWSEDISGARLALSQRLAKAKVLILTDYTDATAQRLSEAIAYAELIDANESAEYASLLEAISALDDATLRLVAKKADLSRIKLFYTGCKYSNTVEQYNQSELELVLLIVEEALANENILISEVEAIENRIDEISFVTPVKNAEEFMAMQSDGSYVLSADIEIGESYGEFSGYLHGNGHSITVKNGAIFNSLNGATVIDIEINGSIVSAESVGALANEASGSVRITKVVNNATVSADISASGFIAESRGANIFFNSCINNADIDGGIVAGFVARNIDEKSGNILFEYCSSLGNLRGKGSASAFFGNGNANIEMYGCTAGGMDVIEVSVDNATGEVGGVIGNVHGGIDMNACFFSLKVASDSEDDSVSMVFCGANVTEASVKNVFAYGSVTALNNNTYRLTSLSKDKLITDTVFLNVSLMIDDGDVFENPNAVDTTEKNDISAYDEASVNEANCGVIAFLLSLDADVDAELKAEGAQEFIDSLKMLKTPEQVELDKKKADIKKVIQILLKNSELYTEASYAEYIADIEKLIADIDSADGEALEAIKYSDAINSAEKKLVTLEQERALAEQAALADAKKIALAILSAKRENVGKVFTQDSYTAYLNAFDGIVEKINSASDVKELENIDVPALKVAAENLLVVYVPGSVEDDGDYEPSYDEDKLDDDLENDNSKVENDEPASSDGCASSASISALAAVLVIGTAVVFKKKD